MENRNFSPLSPRSISDKHHRELLLVFMLSELIESYKNSEIQKWELVWTPAPYFFPYEWGRKVGCLNKLKEHSLLLKTSFSDRARCVRSIEKAIDKAMTLGIYHNRSLSSNLDSARRSQIEAKRSNEEGHSRIGKTDEEGRFGKVAASPNSKEEADCGIIPSKEKVLISLRRVYSSLEPLLQLCKDNENLVFFLLKERSWIETLTEKGHLRSFLLKIHPCGLEVLGEKMCDQYHRRGFLSQIPEFKGLLTELSHA